MSIGDCPHGPLRLIDLGLSAILKFIYTAKLMGRQIRVDLISSIGRANSPDAVEVSRCGDAVDHSFSIFCTASKRNLIWPFASLGINRGTCQPPFSFREPHKFACWAGGIAAAASPVVVRVPRNKCVDAAWRDTPNGGIYRKIPRSSYSGFRSSSGVVCMACAISVRITRRILPVFRKFRRVFSEQPTLIANSFCKVVDPIERSIRRATIGLVTVALTEYPRNIAELFPSLRVLINMGNPKGVRRDFEALEIKAP